MQQIPYQRTWCDYLTPCPFNNNIEVGSYYCSQCKNFISVEEETKKFSGIDLSYKKYFEIIKGTVNCKKNG